MGPNGTGKSSIIAAIAIGLGWHPGVLGRSRELTEYIRYGCDAASVEIVLRCESRFLKRRVDGGIVRTKRIDVEEEKDRVDLSDIDTSNGYVIIRRNITKAINKNGDKAFSTEFFLNDEQVSAKKVAFLVKSMNIQIDNLCQFLPQDKVSEFAKMTPIELLAATQKAAAEPAVQEEHSQLIALSKEVRTVTTDVEREQSLHDQLVKQNEALNELVQRIHEREERVRKVALCKRKRPWMLYNDARDRYLQVKERKAVAQKEFEAQAVSTEPLRKQIEDCEKALVQKERKGGKAEAQVAKAQARAEQESEKLVRFSAQCQDKRDEIRQHRMFKERQRVEIVAFKAELRAKEEEHRLAGTPNPIDEASYKTRIREVNKELEEFSKPLGEINSQQEAIRMSIQGFRKEMDASQRQLAALQNAKTRRLGCLGRHATHSFQAWEWLESNRNRFRQRVYGPLCLELHVADVQMADLIEGAIPRPVMTSTFYCYEEADYELLMTNLIDNLKLPVNISLMTVKNKDTFLANNHSTTVRQIWI